MSSLQNTLEFSKRIFAVLAAVHSRAYLVLGTMKYYFLLNELYCKV